MPRTKYTYSNRKSQNQRAQIPELTSSDTRTKCRRRGTGATALVLAFSLSLCPAQATPAEEYQENLDMQSQLQDQMAQNQQDITAATTERTELQAQYAALSEQFYLEKARIDALDAEIRELEEQLEYADQEFADQYRTYCIHVRSAEEYGTSNYWSIIFGSSSIGDLLVRLDYIDRLLSHDQMTLDQLQNEIDDLDRQAAAISEKRAARNQLLRDLQLLSTKLLKQINQRMEEIERLASENEALQAEYDNLVVQNAMLLHYQRGGDYTGSQSPEDVYQKYVVDTGEAYKTPLGARIAAATLPYLGGEYVWGGASPETGFDCSGLVSYVYRQFGYSIQRTAQNQFLYSGQPISPSELSAGDLVFFHPPGKTNCSHVGMYIGGSMFIHASSPKNGIKVSSLQSKYYQENYLGAKRIIES